MSELAYKSEKLDGIEFYVSEDGKTTGMSINGLSRCCGVDRKTIKNILQNGEGGSSNILKPEVFAGNVFIDLQGGASENNARIVKSNVCAELITYYAYKSKNYCNEVAKNTLDKFIKNGIDNWIKDLVGFDQKTLTVNYQELSLKMDKICEIMLSQQEENQEFKRVIHDLIPVVEEYTNVKDGIHTIFRGLETVIEHVKNEKYVLPTGNLYTLSEWLQTKEMSLSYSGLRKLGRTVAETFKSCTVAKPKKKNYLKPNGKWSCNCTAYSEEHFPLLEMALTQFMQS